MSFLIFSRTRHRVLNEELLEVPEAEVGDLGPGGVVGGDVDVRESEVAVDQGRAEGVEVGDGLGDAWKAVLFVEWF